MKQYFVPIVAFAKVSACSLLLLPIALSPLCAQKTLHIAHGCAYKTATEDTDIYTFEPSAEADRIVSEICNAMGVSQNFDVRSANVENAMATNDGPRRIILYSTVFLKKFNEDARTRWAAYSVLAHEIGHHFNGHDFSEPNPGKRKQMELEADRFSGSALRLLGANLDESKAGIESFALQGEQAKHPSAKARLEALANGWNQMQERLAKMGAGVPTPDSNIQRERDTDSDGIPDKNDACPEEYGRSLTAGCPDADEDGIPDAEDKCRYLKGPSQWKGCPDTDGDGIPDHEDRCPRDPGYLTDGGCPPPDRDGDSVTDRADKCPDTYGQPRFQGCPDTDGDGVPDPDDKCPKEKGDALYEGCLSLTNPFGKSNGSGAMPDNMVLVKGGTFKMGDVKVTLQDFYIGKYEVTQEEWQRVMGNNPSSQKGCDKCPVETVSWSLVNEFIKKLNAQSKLIQYRLPTEAEWEFAARGGVNSSGFVYAGSSQIEEVAWYVGNSKGIHYPVGLKKANELGLFDMCGNVREWCQDNFVDASQRPFDGSALLDKTEARRITRGGDSDDSADKCPVDYRQARNQEESFEFIGFRLAATRKN